MQTAQGQRQYWQDSPYFDYEARSNVRGQKKKRHMTARDRQHALILVLFVGIMGILIIITTAYAATINYHNNQLQSDIAALEGEVEALEVEIQSKSNVAIIESKATEDLGMKYAEGKSYVIVSKGKEKKDNFAAKLKENAFD